MLFVQFALVVSRGSARSHAKLSCFLALFLDHLFVVLLRSHLALCGFTEELRNVHRGGALDGDFLDLVDYLSTADLFEGYYSYFTIFGSYSIAIVPLSHFDYSIQPFCFGCQRRSF